MFIFSYINILVYDGDALLANDDTSKANDNNFNEESKFEFLISFTKLFQKVKVLK